jgi:Ca-activated chloride channel family protein
MNSLLSALINGVILSAFITTVVWLVMRFTSTRIWNAATRYAVWWATLLVTIAIPALTVSIDRLPRTHPVPPPPGASGLETSSLPRQINTSLPQPPASLETSPGIERPAPRRLFPIQVVTGRWVEWIVLAWIAVSLLMLARLVVSYILLERRKQRASLLPAYETRLQEWLARCRVGRSGVRLAVSAEITTPVAAGPYRPSILIPARMLDALKEDELHQIGLHEAAHFKRKDDYALVFERILEALFVFHPVLRWITGRIDLEREMACDDVVVQITGRAAPYASCLTRVVELADGVSVSRLAASAAEPQSQLERRVEMLLDDTRKTGTHLLKLRLAAAVTVLALLVLAGSEVPNFFVVAAPLEEKPQETQAFAPASRAVPVSAEEPVVIPSEARVEPRTEPARILAPAEQTQPVSRIETPDPTSMQLSVVVTDSLNRYVSGLEKEHFKLFENSEEQDITQFLTDRALSIGIVLDVQDSDAAQIARDAISQFIRNGSPEDEYYLTQFSGPTPLLDGVMRGLTKLQSAQNSRKVLLVVSDGKENGSSYTADEISALTNTSDVSIYGISLLVLAADLTQQAGPALLGTLAGQSGGRHFTVANANEMPDVATKIGVELRNTYLLGYQPKNRSQDGKFRQVQVQLFPPKGIQRLNVFSRAGYYPSTQNRGTLSTSEPTILSDTRGFDFGPYLSEVANRVRANWYYRIPESARRGQRGRVVVTFTVLRDGSIRDLKLLDRSGNDALEQAPMTAIRDAAPLLALPAGFSGDSIVVQLTFLYNER